MNILSKISITSSLISALTDLLTRVPTLYDDGGYDVDKDGWNYTIFTAGVEYDYNLPLLLARTSRGDMNIMVKRLDGNYDVFYSVVRK